MLNLKATVGGDVFSQNTKQKVAIPRHQVAFDDILQTLNIFGKSFNGRFILAGQPHADEECHAKAEGVRVQNGHVFFDDTAGLKVPNAPQTGRLRQTHLFGDLVACLLAIPLKRAKKLPVNVVKGVLHGLALLKLVFLSYIS